MLNHAMINALNQIKEEEEVGKKYRPHGILRVKEKTGLCDEVNNRLISDIFGWSCVCILLLLFLKFAFVNVIFPY